MSVHRLWNKLFSNGNKYEYCPNCDANITLQKGYDNELPYWVCRGCGQMLINPEVDGDITWTCDGCGAYLNEQDGFSEDVDVWVCTECGYENLIDDAHIYLSEDEYQADTKNPLRGMSDEDVLELSCFEEIGILDNNDNVIKVRDINSGKCYVKKVMTDVDVELVRYIAQQHVENMPSIVGVYEGINHVVLIEEYIDGVSLEELLGCVIDDANQYERYTSIVDVLLNGQLH